MSSSPALDFEKSLELAQTGEETFQNVYEPWTWPGSSVVPGGLLISECAVAAYKTIDVSVYRLDNVQSQFLSKTDPQVPISYRVQRLSTGSRFAVRSVVASQPGKNVICATFCFASLKTSHSTAAMRYAGQRETPYMVDRIILDDLEPKTPLGPFMKFQRLPTYQPASTSSSLGSSADSTSVEAPGLTRVATSACHISSALSHRPSGHMSHTLGILNLSDYHVLDCPLTLADIRFGLFAIGDTTRTPTQSRVKMYTSLNHSVWFYKHDGFRADEMCYVEGRSSWAHDDGRACIETKMFGKDGALIARIVQEAFYMFKDSQTETSDELSKGKL